MINHNSIIIGISITIVLIKLCNYYLFESELLSSVVYIVVFSLLYDMVSNFFNKGKRVIEGYSTTDTKNVNYSSFVQSNIFKGKKNGYVFKKGNEGLGYYLDSI